MTDIATLLAAPGLEATAFPPNSRWHGVPIATLELPDGSSRAYLRRRFVPQAGELDVHAVHRVTAGDRADIIAARYYGDPTQCWRLSDANGYDYRALTATSGRLLAVALPRAGRSAQGA